MNCKDPKAVIGYLSLMTQYLRSLYAGKTLHAVPHATFTSGAKLTLDDAVQHLITFDEFGRVAEKNKVKIYFELRQNGNIYFNDDLNIRYSEEELLNQLSPRTDPLQFIVRCNDGDSIYLSLSRLLPSTIRRI